MPDIVRSCVLSKCHDGIPRPTSPIICADKYSNTMPCLTSSHHFCSPRAIRAWHTRHRLTVCDVQGPWWHATTDADQLCVLSKDNDGMQHLTLSVCLCFPKAMMACHVWGRPTVCAVQGYDYMPRSTSINCECCPTALIACHARHSAIVCSLKGLRWHATSNFVQPCVLSKGDDGMLRPTLPDHVSCPCSIIK